MKKALILSLAVLLFGFVFISEAEPIEAEPEFEPGMNRSNMREEVDVSPERVAEMRRNIEEVVEQMEEINPQAAGRLRKNLLEDHPVFGEPVEDFCHHFESNLEYRDTGSDVRALETILQKEGYLQEEELHIPEGVDVTHPVTVYNWDLARALYEYQNDHNLNPSPLVEEVGFRFGSETRRHFNEKYECEEEKEPIQPRPTPEYEVLSEADHNRNIDSEMERVVDSQEELERYLPDAPEVDFEEYRVGVIGMGEQSTAGHNIVVHDVYREEGRVVLDYEKMSPDFEEPTLPVITHPSKVVSVNTGGEPLILNETVGPPSEDEEEEEDVARCRTDIERAREKAEHDQECPAVIKFLRCPHGEAGYQASGCVAGHLEEMDWREVDDLERVKVIERDQREDLVNCRKELRTAKERAQEQQNCPRVMKFLQCSYGEFGYTASGCEVEHLEDMDWKEVENLEGLEPVEPLIREEEKEDEEKDSGLH